jgi:hypothetical protein
VVGALLLHKNDNFWIKIASKFQRNRSYGSPGIKETVRGQKTGMRNRRETEREIQSRRESHPSAAMEAMDQRGNSPPIWGRLRKKKKEGGSLPLSPGGAGVPLGLGS